MCIRDSYKSRPGKHLLTATLIVDALTLVLPYTPLAGVFGFIPLPALFVAILLIILILYVLTAEYAKHMFYRRLRNTT